MSSRDRITYINLYKVLIHVPLCNQLRAEMKTTLVTWNIARYMFGYAPIPVAARSKLAWWECGFESRTAARMSVCRECCALSGSGLYVGLITRLKQCFSTAGPRPGIGPWHQFYRAARRSPAICHFSFLRICHE